MENLETMLTPQMLALVPLIVGILQVVKKIPIIQKIKDYLPFVSMGIAAAVLIATKQPDPILPSVIIGLLACGGFEAAKAVTK